MPAAHWKPYAGDRTSLASLWKPYIKRTLRCVIIPSTASRAHGSYRGTSAVRESYFTCTGEAIPAADLDYAKGFAATLADEEGVRVFCAAYRLAPEHPFPAALDDALEAYRYLISKGYGGDHIMLCGESAGGGLCYALCLSSRT